MSEFDNFMMKKMMSVDSDQFNATFLPNKTFVDYLDAMNRVDTRFKLLYEILEDMGEQDKIDHIKDLYNEADDSITSSIDSVISVTLDNEDLERLARINDKEHLKTLSGMITKDDSMVIGKSKDFIKSYVLSYDKICNGLSDTIKEITGQHVLISDKFIEESNKEFDDMKKASNCLMMNNREITIEGNHFDILKKEYDEQIKRLDEFIKQQTQNIIDYFSD